MVETVRQGSKEKVNLVFEYFVCRIDATQTSKVLTDYSSTVLRRDHVALYYIFRILGSL